MNDAEQRAEFQKLLAILGVDRLEQSAARRKRLFETVSGLLREGPIRRQADRLKLSDVETLTLGRSLLNAVAFVRVQSELRERVTRLGRGDVQAVEELQRPSALMLIDYLGYLAQNPGRRAGRGQREDRRERDGFLAMVSLALRSAGIPVSSYTGENGRNPGAWAQAVRALAPWADVDLPSADKDLRMLFAGQLKNAGIPRRRPGPPHRPI